MKKLYILLLALCSLSLVRAQDFPRSLEVRVFNALQNHIAESRVKGVEATIILPDGREYTWVAGTANGTRDVDTMHLWHFASQAKSLMTTVIFQLQEEGLLSVEDKLSDYLPGLEYTNSEFPIKRFLDQTSGVTEIYQQGTPLWSAIWGKRDSVWTYGQLMNWIGNASNNPDPQYSYNNTNWVLIEQLIEKLTGNSVDAEIRKRIIEPLGMKSTVFPTTGFDERMLNGIWSYNSGNPDNRSFMNHDSYITSRLSWIGKSNEVARYNRALHNGELLKPESMELMYQVARGSEEVFDGTLITGKKIVTHYGLGTSIADWDGLQMYGHGGNGLNYSACYHFPEENLTVSIVNNCFGSDLAFIKLFDRLVEEAMAYIVTDESIPLTNNKQVNIYPNPVSDQMNVQLDFNTSDDITLTIFDTSGRIAGQTVIQNYNYSPGQAFRFPLSNNIGKGFYYLRINSGDQLITRPFVVNR